MTLEQDKAYAEACARGAAMQLEKQPKRGRRSRKQQRKEAIVALGSICALCEERLNERDEIRLDKITGKLMHAGCQLYVARTRDMVDNKGITLERIAQLIQVPAPSQTRSTAPPVDPFSPDAPDADL